MDWWEAWESIREQGEGSPYYEKAAGELKEILGGEMPTYEQVVTYASDQMMKESQPQTQPAQSQQQRPQQAGIGLPKLFKNIGPALKWAFTNPNANPYGWRARKGTAAEQLQGGIDRMTD